MLLIRIVARVRTLLICIGSCCKHCNNIEEHVDKLLHMALKMWSFPFPGYQYK